MQQDDLSQVIKRNESTIASKQRELADLASQHTASVAKQQSADRAASILKVKLEALSADLAARDREKINDASARQELERELDDLRKVMAAKSSEDVKRQEADRSREVEMARLREQVATAQTSLETQREQSQVLSNKLRVDFEGIMASYKAADKDLKAARVMLEAKEKELAAVQSRMDKADGEKRGIEVELKRVRDKVREVENNLRRVEVARDVRARAETEAGYTG